MPQSLLWLPAVVAVLVAHQVRCEATAVGVLVGIVRRFCRSRRAADF
jgi:hypothetical protein